MRYLLRHIRFVDMHLEFISGMLLRGSQDILEAIVSFPKGILLYLFIFLLLGDSTRFKFPEVDPYSGLATFDAKLC